MRSGPGSSRSKLRPMIPPLKTIFLWGCVTSYLSKACVRATLGEIKANAPEGIVVLLDIYPTRFVALLRRGAAAKTLEATGKPLDFGFDFLSDAERASTCFATSVKPGPGRHSCLGSAPGDSPFMVVAELSMSPCSSQSWLASRRVVFAKLARRPRHLPIRTRERKKLGSKSRVSAQRGLATHAAICNAFELSHPMISRPTFWVFRARADFVWARAVV